MKMNDEIELHWTLKVSYSFSKYGLFEALADLCLTYYGDIPEEYDYAEFIITWLEDNLKNYKEEFLSILDSEIDTEGEISNDNITDLLDNEEFMTEFRQYLCD